MLEAMGTAKLAGKPRLAISMISDRLNTSHNMGILRQITNNYFAQVASRQIYEYDISSVRQLERKKHEVVTEVKETKWIWE